MYDVYFDMDGCISDFDKAIKKLYGDNVEEPPEEFWKNDCWKKKFYQYTPRIEEGMSLIRSLKNCNTKICILSSTGLKEHHTALASDKAIWLATHGETRDLPCAFGYNTETKISFAEFDGLIFPY